MGDDALGTGTSMRTVDYEAVQRTAEFRELKRRHRSFVLPVTAAALVWYLVYVALAGWAHDFMATPVLGSINVGILLGILQVVTTFAITMIYVGYANRRLDPLAEDIRSDLEGVDPDLEPSGAR